MRQSLAVTALMFKFDAMNWLRRILGLPRLALFSALFLWASLLAPPPALATPLRFTFNAVCWTNCGIAGLPPTTEVLSPVSATITIDSNELDANNTLTVSRLAPGDSIAVHFGMYDGLINSDTPSTGGLGLQTGLSLTVGGNQLTCISSALAPCNTYVYPEGPLPVYASTIVPISQGDWNPFGFAIYKVGIYNGVLTGPASLGLQANGPTPGSTNGTFVLAVPETTTATMIGLGLLTLACRR